MIPASISHKVLYAARILPTLAYNVQTSSHNLNKQLQLKTIVVVGTGRIASANFCLQPKHKHQVGLEKMNKPNLVRWSNFRLRTRPRSSFGKRRDGSESAQRRFPVKSWLRNRFSAANAPSSGINECGLARSSTTLQLEANYCPVLEQTIGK